MRIQDSIPKRDLYDSILSEISMYEDEIVKLARLEKIPYEQFSKVIELATFLYISFGKLDMKIINDRINIALLIISRVRTMIPNDLNLQNFEDIIYKLRKEDYLLKKMPIAGK